MRLVVIKTVDQQALQAAHRVRERAVGNRTALVNEIRGLLAEFGIEIPQGRQKVAPAVSEVLGDGGTDKITLPGRFVATLHELYNELLHMTARIARYDAMIEEEADTHEQAKLLMTIPGIGPKTATAMLATMGDPGNYRNGREWAASIGLVPRQHSTGGRDRLLGISKRGDRYLRCLLVHGARSVINRIDRKDKTDARSRWVKNMLMRRHKNVVVVALANRMARTAWAVLNSGQAYEDNPAPAFG